MIKDKRVLVTRAKHQADQMIEALQQIGATPIHIPLIETVPALTEADLEQIQQALDEVEWIVFTSVNGVKYFFEWTIKAQSELINKLSQKRFAVVGEKTKESLRAFGYQAELVPSMDAANQEGLLEKLLTHVPQEDRILLCQGNLARDDLRRGLEAAGYLVSTAVVYDTRETELQPDAFCEKLIEEQIELITLTSSSTCKHFDKLIRHSKQPIDPKPWHIASIGPQTTATLNSLGYAVDIQAEEYSVEGLIQAIVSFYHKHT